MRVKKSDAAFVFSGFLSSAFFTTAYLKPDAFPRVLLKGNIDQRLKKMDNELVTFAKQMEDMESKASRRVKVKDSSEYAIKNEQMKTKYNNLVTEARNKIGCGFGEVGKYYIVYDDSTHDVPKNVQKVCSLGPKINYWKAPISIEEANMLFLIGMIICPIGLIQRFRIMSRKENPEES